MPFALLIIGLVLLVSAIAGTQTFLLKLVVNDFTGPSNFFYWVVALLLIGALGYSQKLKPVSDGLLALVIVVLVLAKGNPTGPGGGFFKQFTAALASTGSSSVVSAPAAGAGGSTTTTPPLNPGSGSGTLTPCPNGGYTLTGIC